MATRNKGRADRIIAFLNLLPIVDGPAVGQRFQVDPWLEAWIRDIYEPELVVKGRPTRQVRRAVLSVARKNAKSYAVAGLLLAHLIGPEAQPNGQIFSCAVDREQAAVIFHMCRKMIEMTPSLKKVLRVINSTKTIMVMASNLNSKGSVYRALSAESSTKHGLGPAFFVYDEFGEAKNDELWNTMLDGQQAVESPLAVVISTQNNDPLHPLSQMIDDGLKVDEDGKKVDPTIVCHLYAADEDCDLMDEAQWVKANPALNHWKSKVPIATAAAEAARLPSKEANFRRRYLNQRVSMHSTLINRKDWKSCEDKELAFVPHGNDEETNAFVEGEEVYLGLDMSLRHDLTALVMVSATDGSRVESWCWKPEDHLDEHTKRDGVRYDLYAQQGELLTNPGVTVSPRSVAVKIAELCSMYRVKGLAFDRYGTRELLNHFDDIGLEAQENEFSWTGGLRIVPWGQGFRDMSPAVTAFEEAILTRELKHRGQPLLTFCVMNAMVRMDEAGNRKLDKAKSRFRIDAAVALAMALGLKTRDRGEGTIAASPWEDESFKMRTL